MAACLRLAESLHYPPATPRHFKPSQGLAGCGFDPMAAEGTRTEITFWVWDSDAPPLNASATRVVTVSKACPAAATPHLCSDNNNKHFCSGSPCEQAARFLPPTPRAPTLTLLPSNGTVYLPYGQPSGFYLGPCTNGSMNASCGAVAWDVGADGNVTDLSSTIVIKDVTPCSGNVCVCWVWCGTGVVVC